MKIYISGTIWIWNIKRSCSRYEPRAGTLESRNRSRWSNLWIRGWTEKILKFNHPCWAKGRFATWSSPTGYGWTRRPKFSITGSRNLIPKARISNSNSHARFSTSYQKSKTKSCRTTSTEVPMGTPLFAHLPALKSRISTLCPFLLCLKIMLWRF